MKSRWAILGWPITAGALAMLLIRALSPVVSISVENGEPVVCRVLNSLDPLPPPGMENTVAIGGFGYSMPRGGWVVWIPLWYLAAAFGLLAGAAWTLAIRPLSRADQCTSCGYSLTGLAPGSPCPECGRGGRRDAAKRTPSSLSLSA